MAAPEDQFKINVNQNLWGVSLSGYSVLGAAEHFELPVLFKFSVAISGIMLLSVAFTTLAYTINYWKNKL